MISKMEIYYKYNIPIKITVKVRHALCFHTHTHTTFVPIFNVDLRRCY